MKILIASVRTIYYSVIGIIFFGLVALAGISVWALSPVAYEDYLAEQVEQEELFAKQRQVAGEFTVGQLDPDQAEHKYADLDIEVALDPNIYVYKLQQDWSGIYLKIDHLGDARSQFTSSVNLLNDSADSVSLQIDLIDPDGETLATSNMQLESYQDLSIDFSAIAETGGQIIIR